MEPLPPHQASNLRREGYRVHAYDLASYFQPNSPILEEYLPALQHLGIHLIAMSSLPQRYEPVDSPPEWYDRC